MFEWSPDQRRWIRTSIDALADELEAVKRQPDNDIDLENGVQLDAQDGAATYRFDLFAPTTHADGTPAEVLIDKQWYPAEILTRVDLSLFVLITFKLGEEPPTKIRRSKLRANPWFLVAALLDRIVELGRSESVSPPCSLLVGGLANGQLDPPDRAVELPFDIVGNAEQVIAVRQCLAHPVWFVWGPPGTGKTSTLGELVAAAVADGARVLVAAHSNVAVDACVRSAHDSLSSRPEGRRLLRQDLVVRAGRPVAEDVVKLGLSSRDVALRRDPDLAQQLAEVEAELKQERRAPSGRLKDLRNELVALRAQLRNEEDEVIRGATVLFATLSRCVSDRAIVDDEFASVIVDEASMASPAQIVAAAGLASERVSIFGDFRQLAPIVVSRRTETVEVLGTDVYWATGVARQVRAGGDPPAMTMLREQYRMHPHIREVVGNFAYGGKLRDGDAAKGRNAEIASIEPHPGQAIAVVNTGLIGGKEWRDARRSSRCSPASAIWAFRAAASMMSHAEDVLVLSPYRAHTRLVASLSREAELHERVRVGTVHRFQGSEADAVVFDLVDGPTISRLGRPLQADGGIRLLTVGMSRARGKLVMLSHPNLMTPRANFEVSGKMLAALRQRAAPLPPTWSLPFEAAKLNMTYVDDLDEHADALRDDLLGGDVVLWMPAGQVPSCLRSIRATYMASAPNGQAIAVCGEVTWVLGQLPRGTWGAWRVESPRFANGILDVLAAGTMRADGRVKLPTRANVPRRAESVCPECEGDLDAFALDGSGEDAALLRCSSCDHEHPVDLAGLGAFVRERGCACPICDRDVRPIATAREIRFRCVAYPECPGSIGLEPS